MLYKLHQVDLLKMLCMRRTLPKYAVLLCLLLCCTLHTNAQLTCSQPTQDEVIRWRDSPEDFTVDWRLESVCSSYMECYGFQPNGDIAEDVQLCPIEIQVGDSVHLLPPPNGSVFTLRPANVSLNDWLNCPPKTLPKSQWLFEGDYSLDNLTIPKRFLETPGKVYIAELPNGFFSNCRYGLRVAITIKDINCRNPSDPSTSTSFCSNHGECGTKVLHTNYHCFCDSTYYGQYCDEFDACQLGPCKNGASCIDEIEGLTGRRYTCACPEGYTGINCTELFGLCTTGQCNNGSCTQTSGNTFSCQCNPGFAGANCQDIAKTCRPDLCKNDATCEDVFQDFVCHCPAGFNGRQCEKNTNDCDPNPCKRGGTCIDGLDDYTCVCPEDYTGKDCSIPVNYCVSDPCENGATCVPEPGGFVCNCSSLYRGPRCRDVISRCSTIDGICKNGGLCIESSVGPVQCQCSPGWTGPTCENLDNLCLYGPCPNYTVCVDLSTVLRPGNYDCVCPQGFRGERCEVDIDECDLSPCRNGATCINLVGRYNCTCPLGYTGVDCEEDIDACLVDGGSPRCENGATCVDRPVGLEYSCTCSSGYTGSDCESEIDECESNPCQNNGSCIDVINGFTCNCTNGFYGLLCETDVDHCEKTPCENNGTCTSYNGGYTCTCTPGYTGYNCTEDINECISAPCHNNATCYNTDGSYRCDCVPGYTGPLCQTEVNECDSSPCINGGICRDLLDGFECLCPIGYTGVRCQIDINECFSAPCQNGGICNDHLNSYSCVCDSTLWAGVNCEVALNNCSRSPCQHNSSCIPVTNTTYVCECPGRYTGVNCESFLPLCNSSPCQNNATCSDNEESQTFSCLCDVGFTGTLCETDVDFCIDNNCENNSTCVDGREQYFCVCPPGFTGQYCQIDINECESSPCQNGALCQDETNGFQCFCPNGFTGELCHINFNECASSPCQNDGRCVDLVAGYTCICNAYYTGANCESLIDNCASNPCVSLPNSRCISLPNSFVCTCNPGFLGPTCETQIDECLPGPCNVTGTEFCRDELLNYTCVCLAGFTGRHCQINIDECENNRCQNGATCIDEINKYRCECVEGYDGIYCSEEFNDCLTQPCGPGTCVDRFRNFTCICPDNGASYDQFCNIIYPCSSNPCQNGARCTNYEYQNRYECECPEGYVGRQCELDRNECEHLNITCQNGGTCTDLFNNFTCVCPEGFTGRFCQFNIDDCAEHACQNGARCEDGANTYECVCTPGWTSRFCSQLITSCSQHPCRNGATCQTPDPGTNSGANFTCVCPSGWTGAYCAVDRDECESDPCRNNGSCTDRFDGYVCSCTSGFTGVNCETNIDECAGNKCQNGGTCEDGVNGYTCKCPKPYDGVYCQLDYDECQSNPCQNDGLCKDLFNGYQCFCKNGFTGLQCELDYDECLSDPCQNGGTCVDGVAKYKCICMPGYTGVSCQTEIDECSSNPCENGANCTDLVNEYICDCPPGFTGERCQININECASAPCANQGYCRDGINSYTCDCPKPYKGENCEKLPCDVDPCDARGICTNDLNYLPYGFRCSCFRGYTGPRCQSDVDDCTRTADSFPCNGRGLCVDGLNSYSCFCEPGWKGKDCDLPIDECATSECRNNATCVNKNFGYDCDCLPGWEGQFCEREKDECQSSPCKNQGTCVDLFNDFKCTCLPGWTGKVCEEEINECEVWVPNPCQNGATCVDQFNNVTCVCPAFYTGTYCQTRYDPCDPGYNQCLHGATCLTQPTGEYRCVCSRGFSGVNCEIDQDECLSNPCRNAARCEDLPADYKCHCLPGFTGKQCEVNIDDCVTHTCKNNATCVDMINGFMCNCTAGFHGENCTDDVNECADDPCLNGATCNNLAGTFSCSCTPGYTGHRCEADIDECISFPCKNGAVCTDDINQYTCFCTLGYTGTQCQINIDDCQPNPCINGKCTDLLNNYTCSCDAGWTGRNCDINIDECASDPCINNGTCQDIINGYKCHCPTGYTGPECEVDIAVCSLGNFTQCANGGTCIDGVGSDFSCSCREGFTGSRCEVEINECSSSPCQNGATCQDQVNSYICQCPEGFTGLLCETDISECLSSPCLNEGLCIEKTNAPGFECLCKAGFGGLLCEVNYDDCVPAPKCLNQGVCIDGVNNYTCQCPVWTTGPNCEEILNTSTIQPTPTHSSSDSAVATDPFTSSFTLDLSSESTEQSAMPGISNSRPLLTDAEVSESITEHTSAGPGELNSTSVDANIVLTTLSAVRTSPAFSRASLTTAAATIDNSTMVATSESVTDEIDNLATTFAHTGADSKFSSDITAYLKETSSPFPVNPTTIQGAKNASEYYTNTMGVTSDMKTTTKGSDNTTGYTLSFDNSTVMAPVSTTERPMTTREDAQGNFTDIAMSTTNTILTEISTEASNGTVGSSVSMTTEENVLNTTAEPGVDPATGASTDLQSPSTVTDDYDVYTSNIPNPNVTDAQGSFVTTPTLTATSSSPVNQPDSVTSVDMSPSAVPDISSTAGDSDARTSTARMSISSMYTSMSPVSVSSVSPVHDVDNVTSMSNLYNTTETTIEMYITDTVNTSSSEQNKTLYSSTTSSFPVEDVTSITDVSVDYSSMYESFTYSTANPEESDTTVSYSSSSSSEHSLTTSVSSIVTESDDFRNESQTTSTLTSVDLQTGNVTDSYLTSIDEITVQSTESSSVTEESTASASVPDVTTSADVTDTNFTTDFVNAKYSTETMSTQEGSYDNMTITQSSTTNSVESTGTGPTNVNSTDLTSPPTYTTVTYSPGTDEYTTLSEETSTTSAIDLFPISTNSDSVTSVTSEEKLTSSYPTSLDDPTSTSSSEPVTATSSSIVSTGTVGMSSSGHPSVTGSTLTSLLESSSTSITATPGPTDTSTSVSQSDSSEYTSTTTAASPTVTSTPVLSSTTGTAGTGTQATVTTEIPSATGSTIEPSMSVTGSTMSVTGSTMSVTGSIIEPSMSVTGSTMSVTESTTEPSKSVIGSTSGLSSTMTVSESLSQTTSSLDGSPTTEPTSLPVTPTSSSVESTTDVQPTSTTSPSVTSSVTPSFTTVAPEPESCADSPCMNGGLCYNTTAANDTLGYVCDCPYQYEGTRCQSVKRLPSLQYSGDSFLMFDPPQIDNESFYINLSFNTSHPDGVLLYSAKDYYVDDITHYIRLFTENGILKYQFSCVVQSYELSTEMFVSNGEYHNVSIRQHQNCVASVSVESPVNESTIELGMPFVFKSFKMTELDNIYVGGLPANITYIPQNVHKNFTGCISDLKIDQRDLQYGTSIEAVNVEECGSSSLPPPPPPTTPIPLPTCTDVQCLNGATCVNVATSTGQETYQCNCPLHYKGRRCEQEISVHFPRFFGNSYLEHAPLGFIEKESNEIYVTFKTSSQNGTILYSSSTSGDFLQLFIDDGVLKHQLSCGRTSVLTLDTRIMVNTDKLVGVTIIQSTSRTAKECSVSITVDSNPPVNSSLSTSQPPSSTPLGPLYLGGLAPDLRPVRRASPFLPFTGCIRHLQINSAEKLPFQDAVRGQNVEDCNVPACSFYPCRNNGTCHLDGEDWYCVCPKGYTGGMCERTVCDANLCYHGGTCIHNKDEGSYACLCPYGRHGANCSEALVIKKPYFSGNQYNYPSFMSYPFIPALNFDQEIRFKFALHESDNETALQNSIMVAAGQKGGQTGHGSDFIAVGILEGKVAFRFDLGSGMADLQTPLPLDGNLLVHTVHIGRSKNEGWLKVDDQLNVTGKSKGKLVGLNLASDIFVGGLDQIDTNLVPLELARLAQYSFTGCIYDIELRAGRYGRWRSLGRPKTGRNVGECHHSECRLNQCQNGGTCIDLGASFRCECAVGWKGLLCADRTTPCDGPHSCAPGSRCVPLSAGGHTCHCPLGMAGINCATNITISDARFIGESSFMAFRPVRNAKLSLELEIQFRPDVPTGLLLYLAEHLSERTSDYFSISLLRGYVQVRFNTGTLSPTVVMSNNTVNTAIGAWNTLKVSRNITHASVNLNGITATVRAQPGLVGLDVTTPLFVGGLPELSSLAPEAVEDEPATFEGCVRFLSVNGYQYKLDKTDAIKGLNVVDCDGTNCGYTVCENGGQCSLLSDSSINCTCTENYFGDRCQTSVLCRDNDCGAGSTCVPEIHNKTYTCLCPIGKVGPFCKQDVKIETARFTGSSFIYLEDRNFTSVDVASSYIGFNFSTTATAGVILWNGVVYSDSDDYLGIGIEGGRLKVVASLGWWTRNEVNSKLPVNDGTWHSLSLQREGRTLKLRVDSEFYSQEIPGEYSGLDTHGIYHIGGFEYQKEVRSQSNGHFTLNFQGCIKDLIIKDNGSPIELTPNTRGVNVESCDPV